MAWPLRADGAEVGVRRDQSVPFHVHVSPNAFSPVTQHPPNSTTRLRASSVAAAESSRAGGAWAGCSWVHVDPFHDHVSRQYPVALFGSQHPPNSRSVFVTGSHAITAPYRAGGAAAGVSCVQEVPSNV